jgi:hypothetical protein
MCAIKRHPVTLVGCGSGFGWGNGGHNVCGYKLFAIGTAYKYAAAQSHKWDAAL